MDRGGGERLGESRGRRVGVAGVRYIIWRGVGRCELRRCEV